MKWIKYFPVLEGWEETGVLIWNSLIEIMKKKYVTWCDVIYDLDGCKFYRIIWELGFKDEKNFLAISLSSKTHK